MRDRDVYGYLFFFSSRRRHTRFDCDWSSDVCSSDLRYGIATAHGFAADHQFGAGFELGPQFGCDLVVAREGSYAQAGWRMVIGVRVGVGRYRVSFARDFGVNDIGAAYRVGLEGPGP